MRAAGSRHRTPPLVLAALLTGFCLAVFDGTASGQPAPATRPSSPAPLMALLDRFTAPDVPALAPSETAVEPRKWDKPVPPGLPGHGLAEHPMLYIGEGYNKIFLVNQGRSSGPTAPAAALSTTTSGCSRAATSCSPACSTSPR